MAQINLKIKSDFAQASKDLKNFGTITETERKRIEKYQNTFKTESIDKFIDGNRRLGAGIQANKGDISAIITQQKKLEAQSIRLIRNGLDPQSDEIEKLNDEYNRLQKQYDENTSKSKTFTTSMKKNALAISAGAVAVVALGKKIVDVTGELIDFASEAEETRAKFNTAFSGIEDKALETAQSLADSYGLSNTESEKLLSNTGDLLKGFGATAEEALDMSLQVQQMSVDLASYNNLAGGASQASSILTKAFLGERESLTTLGIKISEANVQQRLLEKGQEDLTGQALLMAKGQATLELAMEQSQDAMGDFARTQDSFANQSRIAEANIKDLKTELGRGLLPIATSGVTVFNSLTSALSDYLRKVNDTKNAVRVLNAESSETALRRDAVLTLYKNEQQEIDKLNKKIENTVGREQALYEQDLIVRNRKLTSLAMELGELEIVIEAEKEVQKEIENKLELQAKEEQEAENLRIASENAYGAMVDSIDSVVNSAKTELEIVQEQIEAIESLEAKDKETNEKRLEALEILNKKKEDIIDEEIESEKQKAQEILDENEKLKNNLIKLNQVRESNTSQSNEDISLDFENLASDITDYMESAFKIVDSIMTDDLGDAISETGDLISKIGEESGNMVVQVVGEVTSLVGDIVNAFEDAEDEVESITEDLADTVSDLMTSNTSDWLDYNYEITKNAIDAQEEYALNAYLSTLSTKEKEALRSAGIIEETEVERIERELKTATDAEKALLEQELEIEKIRQQAEEASAQAEKEYTDAVNQANYESSVAELDAKIAELEAQKITDSAGLWWNPWQQAEVESAYDSAISKIGSITVPPPIPTAETGTPMGGFTVPQTDTERGDNVAVMAQPGETVNVTPRGETGGMNQTIVVQLDTKVLYSAINKGIRSGEVKITNKNIQSGRTVA